MTKDEAIGMLTYLLTRHKNAILTYGTLPNNLEHMPDEFRKPYALVRKALTDYELATAIHAFFTRKPAVDKGQVAEYRIFWWRDRKPPHESSYTVYRHRAGEPAEIVGEYTNVNEATAALNAAVKAAHEGDSQ